MNMFVILVNFTDQGIRNIKDTCDRLEAFRAMAQKKGVTIKNAHYLMGEYDMLIMVEGNDDAVATTLMKLGSLGNVKTKTLRAFSSEQMRGMIGNIE